MYNDTFLNSNHVQHGRSLIQQKKTIYYVFEQNIYYIIKNNDSLLK